MDFNRPIPLNRTVDGWQNVPIIEKNEKMVLLNTFAPEYISVSPVYYIKKIPYSRPEQYVRETVANKLFDAAKRLPVGYKFFVWDAWRPIDVQRELFNNFYGKIKNKYNYSDNKTILETLKYVSSPSIDNERPSPHFTGGAIDLTIIDENSELLNMGTTFDFFNIEAHTDYYERTDNLTFRKNTRVKQICSNRRLLYNVMIDNDFTNYPNEWWHFDYGNQFWAVQKKCFAIFSGINL